MTFIAKSMSSTSYLHIKITVDAEEYDERSEEELRDWIEKKCYAADATLESRNNTDMDWKILP